MKDKPEIAAITVIVVGIGLIAGLVVNEQRRPDKPSSVLGTQFTQPPQAVQTDLGGIPTLPVTIPPLPVPTATVTQTVTATPTARATTSPRDTTASTARTSGVELYNIEVVCASSGTSSDGKQWANSARKEAERLVAGYTYSYTFLFDANKDQRVSRSCTFTTTRVSSGAESPLRVLLSCEGESSYSSAPPDPRTSAISKTWRPSQLTNGFTHRMASPRQSQQSEKTTCKLSAVRV